MTNRRVGLTREAALYLSAQQFLTRLPSPALIGWDDARLARSAKWFPVVGLMLGCVVGATWWATAQVVPATIAAGIALGLLLLLTGGLHEDGLADCCDGLGGGSTRERALEIMRDSRIGTYGGLGLIVSVGLRWSALSAFTPWQGFAALVIALAAGRAAMTMMLWSGVYARKEGAAASVAGGVTGREAVIAMAIAIFLGVAFGDMLGGVAVLVAFVLAQLWLMRLTAWLGGYTGDGLGAAEQIGQITVLIILAGVWA